MKKVSEKTVSVITACILSVIILVISVLCFSNNDVLLISGDESNSPYYHGNRSDKKVGLAINVYEGEDIVIKMLDVLKKYNMTATFFIGGCWANRNIDTVKKIYESGCEIGNHGYLHKDHAKLTDFDNEKEIKLTEELLFSVLGFKTVLFAPPSGSFSSKTLQIAEKLGYKTIMWSKDTVDWRDKNKKTVYNRATKNITGGDIVLMHPFSHTLDALPEILKTYEKLGLTATTVSECIGLL